MADEGRDKEVRYYGTIDGSLDALDKVLKKLVSRVLSFDLPMKLAPAVMTSIGTWPVRVLIALWLPLL